MVAMDMSCKQIASGASPAGQAGLTAHRGQSVRPEKLSDVMAPGQHAVGEELPSGSAAPP